LLPGVGAFFAAPFFVVMRLSWKISRVGETILPGL
jgi:hypothetical protein